MITKQLSPLALAFCLLPNTGVATESNTEPAQEVVSVTADRIEKQIREQSLAISVIDKQDIDNIGHTHISEILSQTPGVWISRGNGQEHLTAIRSAVLTGAGSCGAFYFAEDGIPLRAPGFCNVNALFDVNAEQAERIEVCLLYTTPSPRDLSTFRMSSSS